jgi:hypothetical protein
MPVFGANVSGIVVQVLEMVILLQHGSLIDVVVGGHVTVVRILCQHPDIFEIVAADVDVEKDYILVDIVFAQDVFQVLAGRYERLGKARLRIPGIQGEVEGRDPASPRRSATSGLRRRPLVAIYTQKPFLAA